MEDRPDSEPKQLNNLQRNRHVRLAINVDSSEELCATHRESFDNPATPQHPPTAQHGKPPALPDSAKNGDLAGLTDREHRYPHTPIGCHLQRLLINQPMPRLKLELEGVFNAVCLGLSHVVSLRLLRRLGRDTFFRGKVT